jgi:hypothetical protein
MNLIAKHRELFSQKVIEELRNIATKEEVAEWIKTEKAAGTDDSTAKKVIAVGDELVAAVGLTDDEEEMVEVTKLFIQYRAIDYAKSVLHWTDADLADRKKRASAEYWDKCVSPAILNDCKGWLIVGELQDNFSYHEGTSLDVNVTDVLLGAAEKLLGTPGVKTFTDFIGKLLNTPPKSEPEKTTNLVYDAQKDNTGNKGFSAGVVIRNGSLRTSYSYTSLSDLPDTWRVLFAEYKTNRKDSISSGITVDFAKYGWKRAKDKIEDELDRLLLSHKRSVKDAGSRYPGFIESADLY